jgi:hypothetical protein
MEQFQFCTLSQRLVGLVIAIEVAAFEPVSVENSIRTVIPVILCQLGGVPSA